MISGSTEARKVAPDIIQGFVLDMNTKEPVLRVNVNVADSDESSLTDENGEFRIVSWKEFPVTLQFDHKDFEPVHLKVTCISNGLVIMLKSKY